MLPTRKQYQKWSLPSKWTFWAGLVGIASLILALISLIPDRTENRRYQKEVDNLILQAAQELRYNSEWLSEVAAKHEDGGAPLPVGRMKVDALVRLANSEFERVVQYSYGEEKYIYQEIYQLSDLAVAFGSPRTQEAVETFNLSSEYTLHDIIFLNNFLWWYLTPVAEESLSRKQLYSMGWTPFPGQALSIYGVEKIKLRYFMDDDKRITEFTHYLGLLD